MVVFDHVIYVMLPESASDDRQKVFTMCNAYSFLKFRNLRISCHFNIFENFFKNRGLQLENSNVNFCVLLDELFHMAEKHFFTKKIKFSKIIFKSQLNFILNFGQRVQNISFSGHPHRYERQ